VVWDLVKVRRVSVAIVRLLGGCCVAAVQLQSTCGTVVLRLRRGGGAAAEVGSDSPQSKEGNDA
jgi:hypothetical protein